MTTDTVTKTTIGQVQVADAHTLAEYRLDSPAYFPWVRRGLSDSKVMNPKKCGVPYFCETWEDIPSGVTSFGGFMDWFMAETFDGTEGADIFERQVEYTSARLAQLGAFTSGVPGEDDGEMADNDDWFRVEELDEERSLFLHVRQLDRAEECAHRVVVNLYARFWDGMETEGRVLRLMADHYGEDYTVSDDGETDAGDGIDGEVGGRAVQVTSKGESVRHDDGMADVVAVYDETTGEVEIHE